MLNISELKFDRDGLIPVVVQDFYSKEVLTLAYMNHESIEITLKEGASCFWSRSRQKFWRKGQTSGNFQFLVSLTADCDRDALVMQVIKDGPACHTGSESCFFNDIFKDESKTKFGLRVLYDMILDRKISPKEGSYTTYLFEKGLEKILKKVGEESSEVVIAAMKYDTKETIYEISDLCYHTLVLMAECGISVEEVQKELADRHVVDHKIKQEPMQ